MVKKKAFTLIEMLVTLTILAFLSSVIAFPLFSPLKYHFFSRNVERIKRELILTRQIARVCGLDISLHFEFKDHHLVVTRLTEGEIKAFRFHFRQPMTFNHIHECELDGLKLRSFNIDIDHHGSVRQASLSLIMKDKNNLTSKNLLL